MKRIAIPMLFLIMTISALSAGVINYAWPDNPELRSDLYSLRVRPVSEDGNPGGWEDVFVFNHRPRRFSHPVSGSIGVPDAIKDRETGFVQFAFTGAIEVEVRKQYGDPAPHVEIAPKAYEINPHYFDGKTVRFLMRKPVYISVHFDSEDNKDDHVIAGRDIKFPMLVFTDPPEEGGGDYAVPSPDDSGVVIWDNTKDIDEILEAEIIYFPPGDHRMKGHKDNIDAYLKDNRTIRTSPLYHGQLRLKKSTRIYVAGGAYVRGAFNAMQHPHCRIYGRGIISGRDHVRHDILIPTEEGTWDVSWPYEASFIDFIGADHTEFYGVVMMEPFHHTCPSGNHSIIKNIKILSLNWNGDGVRTGSHYNNEWDYTTHEDPADTGSVVDGVFFKCLDDDDYARNPHVLKNCVFWPLSTGAGAMLSWSTRGGHGAVYRDNIVIHSEWQAKSGKGNHGFLGSNARFGITAHDIVVDGLICENTLPFVVNLTVRPGTHDDPGFIRNYNLRNVKVTHPFQHKDGTPCKQRMAGTAVGGDTCWVEHFTYTNWVVAGRLVTWENHSEFFDLNLKGVNGRNADREKCVRNILFRSEGNIHKIRVKSGKGGHVYPTGHHGVIDCPEGTNQTISIIPHIGHRIKKVVVDGQNMQRIQVKHFADVRDDHEVWVEFTAGDDYFGDDSAFSVSTP